MTIQEKKVQGAQEVKSKPVGSASNLVLERLDDIKDKRIGVLLGSIHDAYATKKFPNATILQYQNSSDLVIALNTSKIDVAFFSRVHLPEVMSANPRWVF